ncbi:hypothetical protein V8C86DRAFT_2875555 [Haematococcus lacustris]
MATAASHIQAYHSAVRDVCGDGVRVEGAALHLTCQQAVQSMRSLLQCHGRPAVDLSHNKARQAVLDGLLPQLDAAVQSLAAVLEDLPTRLTDPQPFEPDPHEVVAYAHRLRFTSFYREGTASLPPAPQVWQMAQSNLQRYNQQQRMQQEQAQAQTLVQPLAAQPLYPAPAPQEGVVGLSDQELQARLDSSRAEQEARQAALPVEQPAAAARAAPSEFDFILNPDMEVVSSASDSDEDSDF